MTSPRAIVTSALATTMISLFAASIINSALPPDASTARDPHLDGLSQARPYQLSPIPAGADWGRS